MAEMIIPTERVRGLEAATRRIAIEIEGTVTDRRDHLVRIQSQRPQHRNRSREALAERHQGGV